MKRVALLVTHLMGSGHLVRILALARALAAAGAEPVILSGGHPLPHLDTDGLTLVQLPPLVARVGDYRTLREPDGTPADGVYLARRQAMLCATLRALRPDVLVSELWPFGRRVLSGEFQVALDAVDAPALVSLRDVPEPPSKPGRVAEALARAARFEAVLVHGDGALLPLDAVGWPVAEALGAKLVYTGYVATPAPAPIPCPDMVLVAVGGGAVGRPLLAMAAQAARGSALRWHLMVGGSDAPALAASLAETGPVHAEPVRADYRARLGGAAVSISLAGYNTAVEVALSGTPALLVPMAEGGEREQSLRARAFAAALPATESATVDSLTPGGLAAIAHRLADGPRPVPSLAADGAAASARRILAA